MARLIKAVLVLGLMLATASAGAGKPAPTVAEQRLMASGVRIVSRFDSVSGLRAIVADNGKDRRLFYVTPDGKSLVAGLVFDEKGRNITNDDMSRAGIGNGNRTTTLTQLQAQIVWKTVQSLTSLKDGGRGIVVYTFIDPQCNYCHRWMAMVRPHIAAGRLQLRWLPVAILSESSKGLAESMYATPNAATAVQALEDGTLKVRPQSNAVKIKLARNLLAMRDTGARAVPVLVYRLGTRVVVSTGVPSDAEFAAILRGK